MHNLHWICLRREGSSVHRLKLLEYMACKRPVLSTPVPEVVRTVGDAVTMYGDGQELRAILQKTLSGDLDFSTMIDKGYSFALSRSWPKLSDNYERLLLQLTARKRNVREDAQDHG